MININETMNKIDSLLADRGLTSDYKEQAVRQLLYHLYIALDIYRYMTCSEKNKAGYWYRMFRSSFSLTGFLKERKRKRDKEKSPLHPSYKERETELKEKAQKNIYIAEREDFHQECLGYVGMYDEQRLADFYNYWSEVNEKTGKMRFKEQRYWNTERRLKRWMNTSYSADNTAAAIRLKRTRKKKEPEQVAEREDANARLEQEIAERKRNAVSYEEWQEMKKLKIKD